MKEPSWNEAKTLRDVLYEIFKKKETDSDAFKALLNVFGRERIKLYWNEYLQDQKKQADSGDAIQSRIPD